MTDAPKRIWSNGKSNGAEGDCWLDCSSEPNPFLPIEYHRADLSADLVRAGYLAGLEAAACLEEKRSAHWDAKIIRALADDPTNPEAIAAIVACVTEAEQ